MGVLKIKNPEAHALARELAARTGNSLTKVVTDALRERLERDCTPQGDISRVVERILEIGRRAASRPVLDSRSPDEIIAYNELGVFSS